jgi:hypothetical protein
LLLQSNRLVDHSSLFSFRFPNELILVFKRTGISMPLTRGQIVGHDNERLAFAFTMIADGETVQCQISDAAMDELAGAKGTPSIARQTQFVTHRDTIERMASDLFDKAPSIKGHVVRIFSKHIQGERRVT